MEGFVLFNMCGISDIMQVLPVPQFKQQFDETQTGRRFVGLMNLLAVALQATSYQATFSSSL